MRTAWCVVIVALCLSPVVAHADPAAPDALRAERARRIKRLVDDEFHSARGVVIEHGDPWHFEWMIARGDPAEDNAIALWFEAARGQVAVKLTDPRGVVLTTWQARSGEQRLVRPLLEGRYTLDVTPRDGATTVNGVLGVKGPALWPCKVDAARLTEHPADPAHGFAWPYLVARAATPSGALLVVPNNTGFETSDLGVLRTAARCDVAGWQGFADRVGADLLVPMFPRPAMTQPDTYLYLHALTRAALLARPGKLARVDRQLIAMIDQARAQARHPLDARVWMAGFSAAAMFVNRFTVLHPERVRAAAVISPGGWPIAPVATERGERLTYPIGIADLDQLDRPVDLAGLRRVPMLFMLGSDDSNDSVPYHDSYSEADAAVVVRLFGATPVARWPAAERLYRAAGLDARFKLYPDTAHDSTPAMNDDMAALFTATAPGPSVR